MDEITPDLVENITEIRDTGLTNMLDRNMVQVIANDMEMYGLVVWIEDNDRHYMDLLHSITAPHPS